MRLSGQGLQAFPPPKPDAITDTIQLLFRSIKMRLPPIDFNIYVEYKDGDLYWKERDFGYQPAKWNRNKAGTKAGKLSHYGYVILIINQQSYLAHRIVFWIHHGYIPDYIDHIDRNRTNNKIENLRECNQHQNGGNTKVYANSSSGLRNIRWNERSNRWLVNIRVKQQYIYVGCFKELELAKVAAREARIKYFGEFAALD